jgi:hypothetical protein
MNKKTNTKTSPDIIRLKKGTFWAGGIVYPKSQFEEVFTAQLDGKPLPDPKPLDPEPLADTTR